MSRVAGGLLFFALMLPCVACDQFAKGIAEEALQGSGPVLLLDGIVRFELAENPGAFLSMGESLPESARLVLFGLLAPVGLLFLCFTLLRAAPLSMPSIAGMALLVGGGLGNWIDRFFNGGAVIDFVSVGVGSVRTGIFNVSDVAIVAGGLIVLLFMGRAGLQADPEADSTNSD